jgi:hypothetical protein
MEIKVKGTREVEHKAARVDYLERLVRALDGDPSQWEYRGDCYDNGHGGGFCSCGHPIRFEFIVHKGDKKKVLGSSCIETYASINPAILEQYQADLARLLKAIADAKKAARERAQEAENGRLHEVWLVWEAKVEAEKNRLLTKRARERWLNGTDYDRLCRCYDLLKPFKPYKRLSAWGKEFTRRTDAAQSWGLT